MDVKFMQAVARTCPLSLSPPPPSLSLSLLLWRDKLYSAAQFHLRVGGEINFILLPNFTLEWAGHSSFPDIQDKDGLGEQEREQFIESTSCVSELPNM